MSWADFIRGYVEPNVRLTHAEMPDLIAVANQVLTGVTNDGSRLHAHCPLCHRPGSPWKSLLINLTNTYANTYGYVRCQNGVCAWRGPWNRLAEELGIDPLVPNDNAPFRQVEARVDTYQYQGFDEFPLEAWADREWDRNFIDGCGTVISPYAFNVLGAKYGVDRWGNEWAWLPGYTTRGELYGHVKLLLSERRPRVPKSSNSIGQWVGGCVLGALQVRREFPKQTSIVVTEGPPDALRLIDHGVAAVPSLGCGTWTSTKSDILVSLGYERVYVCMNTDVNEAGQRGGDKAQGLLEAAGLEVVRVWQEVGVDLCQMSMRALNNYIEENFR